MQNCLICYSSSLSWSLKTGEINKHFFSLCIIIKTGGRLYTFCCTVDRWRHSLAFVQCPRAGHCRGAEETTRWTWSVDVWLVRQGATGWEFWGGLVNRWGCLREFQRRSLFCIAVNLYPFMLLHIILQAIRVALYIALWLCRGFKKNQITLIF